MIAMSAQSVHSMLLGTSVMAVAATTHAELDVTSNPAAAFDSPMV